MNDSIGRVEAIFGELGYELFEVERNEDVYQASFGKNKHFSGTLFVEKDSNFLELVYSFTFDAEEENFLKEHLESMMNICYEYGSYFNIVKEEGEINFSVFSKIYYSGLNVESLEDTLEDFIGCTQELASMFGIEDSQDFSDSSSFE